MASAIMGASEQAIYANGLSLVQQITCNMLLSELQPLNSGN